MDRVIPPELNNPRYITFLLREQGWPQVRLAEATNRSQAAVSYAIQTGCPGDVTRMIVEILGVEGAWVLWPQRYQRPVMAQLGPADLALPDFGKTCRKGG